MKKTAVYLLSAVMLVSMTACGSKGNSAADDPNLIKIDDYEALFTGYEIVADADGADAIVLNYTYTNNSKDADSFEWSFMYHAFQDGKELPTAVVWTDIDTYAAIGDDNSLDIQPGKSTEIQVAYVLSDLTTPVEMEFEALLSDTKDSHTVDITKGASTAGASKTETNVSEPAGSTLTAPQEYWSGDWYGFWIITAEEGNYYDGMDDGYHWWDIAGRIKLDNAGSGSLVFWDQDGSEEDPIWESALNVTAEDVNAEGSLECLDGYFYDQELTDVGMILEPDSSRYDHLILYIGTYPDPQGSGSSFEYQIVMLPWGMTWDNISDGNYHPSTYTDWYVPAIEAEAALPSTIGGEYTPGTMNKSSSESAGTSSSSTSSNTGNTSFSGPTDVIDFKNYEETCTVEFTYPSNLLSEDTFWEKLVSSDETLEVTFLIDWTDADRTASLNGIDEFKTEEGFSRSTIKAAGYSAERYTYYDESMEEYNVRTYINFADASKNVFGAQVTVSSGNSFDAAMTGDMEAIVQSVKIIE